MKLSRASGYAVRALVSMASQTGVPDGQPIPSPLTAGESGVPEKFLLKVLQPLVAQGILLSKKGLGGGYRLARPASKISLLEVVEAVDGPIRSEALLFDEWQQDARDLAGRLQDVCQRVTDQARRVLSKVRVSDLVAEGRDGKK